jgi:predicted PurR-regulated permease PerM
MKKTREPSAPAGARKSRLRKILFILCLALYLALLLPVTASAATDMWTKAEEIIKDVYKSIAGISTVLAGLMSAVAVIGAKVSNNQHKVDQAWDWLKRIWVAWVVINGIGGFISYVVPLLDGMDTLTPPTSSTPYMFNNGFVK